MTFHPLAAFAAALAGNAALSLGMVLQKKHVGWIGARRGRILTGATEGQGDISSFRRDRRAWLAGVALVNLQPVFIYAALLGLPPAVVASTAGASVAFSALFSVPLLGERLRPAKAGWAVALFAGIVAAGLSGGAVSSVGAISTSAVVLAFALPVCVALSAIVLGRKTRPGSFFAPATAAAAGGLGGFMVLPLRLLQTGGGTIADWLYRPWLYLYLAAGIGSFALVQLAYRAGRMERVAPAFYGMQVLWPALASLVVFGGAPNPVQLLAFALIALSVVRLAG